MTKSETTTKTTYRASHPEATNSPVEITTKRNLRWATMALWSDGEWTLIGWSTSETHKGALSAARSTAPYAKAWDAVPVEVES